MRHSTYLSVRSAAVLARLFAILLLAMGGGALGRVAVGGGAIGHYACGGAAFGTYVVRPGRADFEAEEFFRQHGLEQMCQGQRRRHESP